MTIQTLLQKTIDRKASDLHLAVGYMPTLRIDGELFPLEEELLTEEKIEELFHPFLSTEQRKELDENHELDFGYTFGQGRFRINAYYQMGTLAVAFRLIPLKVRGIEELGLPKICHELATLKQGLVLLTGPTGQGKSTSIAAIIEEINQKYGGHILTIEDPIEYIYSKAKAIVTQREVGLDTHSWNNALRAALREDPNVVFIGEMRDYETISAALTIAETGHLVFATLHTNSASQTIDRIIDVFPENQQSQVRLQLANVLEAIISQRLLPALGGGRVPATEILIAVPAVRSVIREGKTYMVDNIIQTSADIGMMTQDMSLKNLTLSGKISYETAMAYTSDPNNLGKDLKK
ncbi:type IV pilus twitching motility protein PilT [Candidatus Microgenomates bacterium]|nr:type IV pilus twitching motility protein PilT [Candidatus Microgenomates bacterium]